MTPPTTSPAPGTPVPALAKPPGPRLLSLDAFRGLVIVLMFLVNVAGTDPAFPSWFAHRGWNDGRMGNGLADFVFPWFLFIVGTAIPFSMASGRGRSLSAGRKLLAALRRGVVIYLLGTLLWCATIADKSAAPGPISWRVLLHWDILPLIGFGYFAGVCVFLLPRWAPIAFVAVVLTLKYNNLVTIPHPDLGRVVWEQRVSVDHFIRARYGWFGTLLTQGLPAASLVVLGGMAGRWMRGERWEAIDRTSRATMMIVVGAVVVALSYVLHRWLGMPYSKDFLTSSYVLVMAGSGAMVLGAMWWAIDIRGATTMWWLRVYGMNALAVYIAAELIWKVVLMRWQVALPPEAGGSSVMFTAIKWNLQNALGKTGGSWAVVALYILAYWTMCWWLWRRKWFIKV
jgi:predicted acyltransferase